MLQHVDVHIGDTTRYLQACAKVHPGHPSLEAQVRRQLVLFIRPASLRPFRSQSRHRVRPREPTAPRARAPCVLDCLKETSAGRAVEFAAAHRTPLQTCHSADIHDRTSQRTATLRRTLTGSFTRCRVLSPPGGDETVPHGQVSHVGRLHVHGRGNFKSGRSTATKTMSVNDDSTSTPCIY